MNLFAEPKSRSILAEQIHTVKKFTVLALLAALFLGPHAAAQEAPAALTPAALLPGETYFLARCSGVDVLLEKAATLDMVRLYKDPEVRAFLAETVEALPELIGEEGAIPFPVEEVWALCRGEITLACSTTLPVFMGPEAPAVALFVDVGEERGAFEARLAGLLDLVVWARNLRVEETEQGGVAIRSLVPSQPGPSVHLAMIGNFFVLTPNRAFLEGMIGRHASGAPGLARDASFVRCRERCGGAEADIFAYVNVKTFKELIQPIYPGDLDQWSAVLGVEQMEAIALSSIVSGGGSRDVFFIDCPGEKTGFLKALSPQPLSERVLLQAPPETLMLLAAAFDSRLMLDAIGRFLEVADPGEYQRFRSDLDGVKAGTGIDIENEVLAAVGSELSLFVTSPRGGFALIPNFFMTLAVEDEAAFIEVEKKLLGLLPSSIQVTESTFQEKAMHHLTIPGSMISPAFCVTDGQLIVASSPLAMKTHIRWLAREEPGLSQTPAFGLGVAGTPENASALLFLNTRKSVELGYGMGAPFLPNLFSGADIPLDAGLLPMGDTLSQYFSSAAGYLVSDETGLALSGRNPIGVGALVAMWMAFFDHLVENDLTHALADSAAAVGGGVSVPPQQLDPDLGAAYTQMQSGSWSVAEVRLSAWLDSHPDMGFTTTWTIKHRGDCNYQLGKYAEAIADYEQVAERDPNARGLTCCDIARVHVLMGETDKAIEFVEKAIIADCLDFVDDPALAVLQDEPRLDVFLGMVLTASDLMMESRYAEAEEIFTHWLLNNQYHTLEAWALKNRGTCHLRLERTADAIGDFEKAARLEESYRPQLYYSIACLYSAALEEDDEAVQYLKRAIDAGFDDFELMGYDSDLDNVRSDPRFEALSWDF